MPEEGRHTGSSKPLGSLCWSAITHFLSHQATSQMLSGFTDHSAVCEESMGYNVRAEWRSWGEELESFHIQVQNTQRSDPDSEEHMFTERLETCCFETSFLTWGAEYTFQAPSITNCAQKASETSFAGPENIRLDD
ncbi:hypothetical protein MHYP_G00003290 [Metynnis hypsauchen]